MRSPRSQPVPSVPEAESLNSVLACHCVKLEQTTAFSGPLSPNLQNAGADPSKFQVPSSLWHPAEKKCYLRDLVSTKRSMVSLWASGLGGHRGFSNGSFSVLDAGQPAGRYSHGMQELERPSSWGEGHCFYSVDCRVRKLEEGSGTPLWEGNSSRSLPS